MLAELRNPNYFSIISCFLGSNSLTKEAIYATVSRGTNNMLVLNNDCYSTLEEMGRMIGTKGYKILSPHVRIGRFGNHLRSFAQFDQISIVGDLLLPCGGDLDPTDEMYDRFKPIGQRLIGTVDVAVWSVDVFAEFGAHLVEDDSMFAIFSMSGSKHVSCVYSIWDSSIVEVYVDNRIDAQKLFSGFKVEKTEFPGAYEIFNKFANNDVLPLIRSVLEGATNL